MDLPPKCYRGYATHYVPDFHTRSWIENSLRKRKYSGWNQPNYVYIYIYTQQFKKHDFFDDACRVFFSSQDLLDRNVNQLALYKDKFALVIDFSTQV